MIKAIVVDINGVVIRQDIKKICREVEQRYTLPRGAFWKSFHDKICWRQFMINKIPERVFWEEVSKSLKRKISGKWVMDRFFSEEYIDKRMIRFLKELKREYTILAYSNAPKPFKKQYSKLGLDALFDLVMLSGDTGVKKPDRRAYEIITERTALRPEEIICIDDRKENIEEAKRIGFNTITYTSAGYAKRELACLLGGEYE